MKMGFSKWAYRLITALLVIMMCVGLVAMSAANRARDDLPVMAEGEETGGETETGEETAAESETQATEETESETETEVETEPVDVSSKGLMFESNGNGTCYVSGMGSCRDSFVILPRFSPEGDRVIGVGDYAFRNCTYLRSVDIHEGIRYIGAYAFYGSGLVNVNIPSEVEGIGDYAFCSCPFLESIAVAPGNQMYSDVDGVLYNKDMTVIITCPQGKSISNFSISSQVSEIKTMAFYHCNTIKLVNYEGGAAAFRRIHVGAGNEPIESAIVSFSSTVPSLPTGAGDTAGFPMEK